MKTLFKNNGSNDEIWNDPAQTLHVQSNHRDDHSWAKAGSCDIVYERRERALGGWSSLKVLVIQEQGGAIWRMRRSKHGHDSETSKQKLCAKAKESKGTRLNANELNQIEK